MSRAPSSRSGTGGGAPSAPSAPSKASAQAKQQSSKKKQTAKQRSKSKGKGKRNGHSKKQSIPSTEESSSDAHSDASDSDSDDPYSTPPPSAPAASSSSASASSSSAHSTAGDQFYDSFAALELKIAAGTTALAHIIRILKQIRVHPDVADRLAEELEDKLSETGALLTEIDLIQARFEKIDHSANDKGKFSASEKKKRASLRARVKQDVEQMRQSYRQLRSAAHAHLQASGAQSPYDPYGADDDSSAQDSLLGSASGGGLESVGLLYQNSEYIGEGLDSHLALLEEQSRERAAFMRNIERDVVQVQQLFSDMHDMVHEQQSIIDVIDDKITGAQENAKTGMEQLLKAQQYQAAKRRRMCCLILMAIVAICLFFLFLWVAFSK